MPQRKMIKRHTSIPEKGIYIADNAAVTCEVEIGENVSIWYGCSVRGDVAPIYIGKNTNIQDNTVVHVSTDGPAIIGENVTVGHGVIIHACTIGDGCLIGMGSIILDGAVIGKNCIIGAGTLITKGKIIPDGSMVYGNPAKIVRQVKEEELAGNAFRLERYMRLAKEHFGE